MEGDGPRSGSETVIIGGGQAGLTTGYHLKRAGRPFVILDAGERIGDAWRTGGTRSGCSPRPFATGCRAGVSRRQVLFPDQGRDGRLPRGLRGDVRASGADGRPRGSALPQRDGFVVAAGERRFEADSVVVATGRPGPEVPTSRASSILRSSSCTRASTGTRRNCGTATCSSSAGATRGPRSRSMLSTSTPTWLSGRVPSDPGPHGQGSPDPRRPRSSKFVGHHVLTTRTPIGRKRREVR